MPGSPHRRRPVKRLRRSIIERDRSICQYCHKKIKNAAEITIDHVLPYCAGGLTVEDNLVVACNPCNQKKGRKVLT